MHTDDLQGSVPESSVQAAGGAQAAAEESIVESAEDPVVRVRYHQH